MPSLNAHRAWLASLSPHDRAHFASLPDPPAHWPGLGLRPAPPGTEAPHTMRADPLLASALSAPPPASDDHLNAAVKGIYNQGNEGSCFPADTRVRMADGTQKAIEEIHLLDEVLTAEGRIGQVTAAMVRAHVGPLVQLRLWGHRHLQATPEHPILTRRGYVALAELTPEDYVAIPKYLPQTRHAICPADYVPSIDYSRAQREGRRRYANRHGDSVDVRVDLMPETIALDADFGRIIGLFLAEGSTTANRAMWTFGIHEAKTLAQELTNLLREQLGVEPFVQVRAANNRINVAIFGKHWRLLFERLCATGSGNKRLHPDLTSGPADFLQGVIDGWMDGDGCETKNGRAGTTVSHDLALSMYDIAQGLGMQPVIRNRTPKHNAWARTRRLRWDVAIANGDGGRGCREQDATHVWRKVHSLVTHEQSEPVFVYNLTVDGDNSYVAEGIGVHNCASFCTSAIVSINEFLERDQWVTYDGHLLYKEVGGVGNSGSSLESNCGRAISPGVPLLGNTGSRDTFDSWAYAPRGALAEFKAAVQTAIAAGRPCMLAVMLPSAFGFDSSGTQTGGYHALTMTMYDDVWVGGPNSWGSGWGKGGFYRLRWDYLAAQLGTYCFAIVPLDIGIPIPPPNPTPVPPAAVALASVTMSTTRLTPGQIAIAHVKLTAPAPTEVVVSVAGTDNTLIAVSGPPILAGADSVDDPLQAIRIPDVDTPVTITFSFGGVSKAVTLTVAGRTPPGPTPPPIPPSDFEARVLALTNAERALRGAGALSTDTHLTAAAMGFAKVLVTAPFSHIGPDGSTPFTRMKAAGADFAFEGENIAKGQPNPENVVAAWINSPGHHANMINPAYQKIGIGFASEGEGGFTWVQDFGGNGGPTPPPPVNVPVITDFQPKHAATGAFVILKGTSFDPQTRAVFAPGVDATEYGIRDVIGLQARIPAGAVSGPLFVQRGSDGARSASVAFVIDGDTPPPPPPPPPPPSDFECAVSIAPTGRGVRITIEIRGGKAPFKVSGNIAGRNLPNLSSGRFSMRDTNGAHGEFVSIHVEDATGAKSTGTGTVP